LKDLRFIAEPLGVSMERIVLLDNSPISFTLNMNNGVPIPDFNGEEEDADD